METFLESGHGYTQTAGRGVDIQANNVTLQGLTINGFTYGVGLTNGTSGSTIDNVAFVDNLVGIHKGATDSISNFQLLGGSMTDGLIGIDFDKSLTLASGTADQIVIDGTDFSHLAYKGIYAEALSNAYLTNITMEDVGQFGAPSTSGSAGSGGDGIDLNLKNGTYSNVEIDNFHLTDTGLSNGGVAGATGHANGGAIVVEARDQGSYATAQGHVTDTISIHDGTIDGSTSTGIQAGEPGQTNAGPATHISVVTITGEQHTAHGDVANVTTSTMTVDLKDGGDSLIVSPTTTGPMIVNGGDGNDTITTGSGNDSIFGGAGNDTITGGGGADHLEGGSGNDVYYAGPTDTIVELGGGGTDEVRTTDSFTLPVNVENLTLLDGDSNTQTFDNMAVGPITDGENGWTVIGNSPRDQAVVDLGGGNHAFQMSSDPSIPDFAGPYSPQLSVAAGEPDTGAAYSGQLIKFDLKAVDPTPDGSRLEIDFGNAAGTDRNNFMVIESFAGGIRIAVSEPTADGSDFTGDETDPPPNDYRQLIAGVDPTVSHTIEMRLDYVDGPDNDVIDIYLDGKLIGTTTTFENYHDALNPGQHIANAQANLTDRVFFRPSANGAPQDGAGGSVDQGFLIDNLTTAVYNNTSGAGNDADNVIVGNDGDNILTGAGGKDRVSGGDGDDKLNIQLATDVVSGEFYDGGAGNDTLLFLGPGGPGPSGPVNLSAVTIRNIENITGFLHGVFMTRAEILGFTGTINTGDLTLTSAGPIDISHANVVTQTINLASTCNNALTISDSATHIINGGSLVDTVHVVDVPGGQGVTIYGNGGNDGLYGGSGDDTLAGGAGVDRVSGGGGDDTLVIQHATDVVNGEIYDGGNGSDTLQFLSADAAVDLSIAAFINIESVSGFVDGVSMTRADLLEFTGTVDTGDITLTTAGVMNISAANVMTHVINLSSTGNNALYISDSASHVINGSNLVDTVHVIDAVGGVGITEHGNDGNDTLYGGSFADTLTGDAGKDTLYGQDGNDMLTGGAGLDKVYGEGGDDMIGIDHASDVVSGEIYDGGADNDTLQFLSADAAVDLTVASVVHFENIQGFADGVTMSRSELLEFTGTVNTGDLTLTDGGVTDVSGANFLTPTVNLSNANNIFTVADSATVHHTVNGGTGNDTINVTGAAGLGATLNGGAGTDHLNGGSGNDTLNDGAGVDTLTGGAGDDTFVFNAGEAAGDHVTDFKGTPDGGHDQLQFVGYDNTATFTQINSTHWQVADTTHQETIVFSTGTHIAADDFHFV